MGKRADWADAHVATRQAMLVCDGACNGYQAEPVNPRATLHMFDRCEQEDGVSGAIVVFFRCATCHHSRRFGAMSPSVRWDLAKSKRIERIEFPDGGVSFVRS